MRHPEKVSRAELVRRLQPVILGSALLAKLNMI
jgi:hypothetical protein